MNPDPRLAEAQMIPIAQVAEKLEIYNLKRAGVESIGPCPVCAGRDRFAINPARNVFNCRVCDRGGDGIEMVRFVLGCTFPDALLWLIGERDVALDPKEAARRLEKAAEHREKQKQIAARQRDTAIRDARVIWERAGKQTKDCQPVCGSSQIEQGLGRVEGRTGKNRIWRDLGNWK